MKYTKIDIQNLIKKIPSYCGKWVRWQLLKKNLQKQIGKNEWGFVCPYGIGDTYFACGLTKELLKRHGGRSVKFFVLPSHSEIPGMFGFSGVVVTSCDLRIARLEQKSKLKPGKIIVSHPVGLGLKDDVQMIGSRGIVFLDLFKKMFDLSKKVSLSNPVISSKQQRKAKKILEKHAYIPGKTVILAPDAVSAVALAEDFWQDLSNKLVKNGFKVFFNKRTDTGVYLGHECLDFRLGEAIPISELAGTVVSMRSGLCDLLSTAKTKLIVLYPDERWYNGSLFNGSSLVKMGICKSVNEIIYQNKDKEKIIDNILSMIHQKRSNS